MENVVLTNPVVVIGFIISMALCIFAYVKKAHIAVTVISIAIFVITATYSLLKGADLYDVGTVSVVFFIINLLPLWKNGGDK